MSGYWNLKSDLEVKNEITHQLSIKSLDFIGKYVKHSNGFTFFENIRLPNFSPLPKIKSNKDDKLANTKVLVQRKDLKNGSYYHFTCKVIPQNKRVKHNNEFIFTVENDSEISEYKPVSKEFIDSIYNRFDKADSANNNDISKALNTITYQINKKPETFIYELLQNADDNAGNIDVNVTFFITEKYLLVFHNGEPFKFNNVFAICSVNAEDKSDDINKIGFKGIGFKSVFKDNDWVFINSGEYSFRFDQSKYSVEKPWQLMPIWTPIDEDLEISIRNNDRFLGENVSIALRPRDNDQKLLSKYSKTLELFNDDRILLFLKKVKQVHVSLLNKEKIHCRKNNAIWGKREYTIPVNSEVKSWLNEQIRNNNQEVPIKYHDIGKFKISYAFKVEGGKVIPLVDSTLFNYLPLSISLGFPFLVNSDFIPDGDREELYLNTWNEYLMIEIGKCLPKFISDIVFQKVGSFHLLPESAQNNFQNSKWNKLYEWFLQGYVESLTGENAIAFIPTKSGSLETLSNILIDETGLFELFGDEFSKLTGISEKLIDCNEGEGVEKIKKLISQHNLGVLYDTNRLIIDIKTTLQDWLKQPTNNFKFIENIYSNETLKGLLNTEEIVLSKGSNLFKASDVFDEVPAEITFLSPKQVSKDLLILLKEKEVELEFKKFEPVQFFKDYVLGKFESLNENLKNEISLLQFWQFIFKYWSEFENENEILNCLKSIEILCKSGSTEQLSKCVISKSYLSAEFNLLNEIESTVRSIIEHTHFISEKYILKSGDEIKWRKIFNRLGVIGDLQRTVDDLLPKLSSINEENHFVITKQIFKYWKENKDKETRLTKNQIELIKNQLKLKTIDSIYLETSKCIISDHYQTNKIIDSTLLEVCLINQISSEYSNTQIFEWNTFFKEIGCISLDEKQHVLNAKLSFIILKQDDIQEIHFEYIKGIYDLYNLRNTNGLDFDFVNTLSQIKLQTSNEQWHLPKNIHLSNSYNPKLSLENDETINSTLLFLNKKYLPHELKYSFLTKLGVKNNFSFNRIETTSFKNFVNPTIKDKLMNCEEFIRKKDSLLSKGFKIISIEGYTRFKNHVQCYLLNVPIIQKYNNLFFDEVVKLNAEYFRGTEIVNNHSSCGSCDNELINFIKENETIENKLGVFVKPSMLFSSKLEKYIDDKSLLPKNNVLCTEIKSEKSIAEIIGINQKLSIALCLDLLSKPNVELNTKEIKELNIVEILSNYKPKEGEFVQIFMLNKINEWKSVNDLFISNDEKIKIEPKQQLHEDFFSLAVDFGVRELTEESLMLGIKPEKPPINNEIKEFIEKKAKYLAFKIDQTMWEEIESNIIEQFSSIKFFEVEFVTRFFPEDEPIYEQIFDFHYDEEKKEVFFKGIWKTNKNVLEFLHNKIQSEKIETVWFDNIINTWDERKIIQTLIDMFGFIPNDWVLDSEEVEQDAENEDDYIDPFWSALTYNDIEFIREIIGGEYELDEQMDSNLAAKIKTLMIIRSDYSQTEISDKGYFLRAGLDDIIVRSAQRGLLFLDLYHWKRLGEKNVKLAIHTNNQITLFQTQQELFDFVKPLNKYGMMKLPVKYSLDDLNSIGKKTENGKWHYVFIVNINTIFAKSYIKAMEYSDPDLFKEDNF